jgi:multidrug resistance protein, MATE family
MNLVDTVAAGRVSAQVLAEVGVGTAMWGVANLLIVGSMMALSPEISRQRGANAPDYAATLAQAIYFALALAALCFVYVQCAPALMRLFKVNAEIIPGASEFLRGICLGLPALCVYIALLKFCEGMGRTKPSLYFGALGLCLLIPLAFGLVQGQFGLPRLLAYGCGLATAIVHWCVCIGLISMYAGSSLPKPRCAFGLA